MTNIHISGSTRRFTAFIAALLALVSSGKLGLGPEALTALVTLTLGYVVQGAAKESILGRK